MPVVILAALARLVAVVAVPVKSPVTSPTTSPVTSPVILEVIVAGNLSSLTVPVKFPAGRLVKLAPEPLKVVAVATPLTLRPVEFTDISIIPLPLSIKVLPTPTKLRVFTELATETPPD